MVLECSLIGIGNLSYLIDPCFSDTFGPYFMSHIHSIGNSYYFFLLALSTSLAVFFLLGFQQNVLVLSSWRSGSTFTGDMLTHYPGTYYLYEPIWAFHETVSQG